MSGQGQPLELTRTEGAVVVALIRGAAWEGVGEHPRVTCNEQSRAPKLWQQRGAHSQEERRKTPEKRDMEGPRGSEE